MDCDNIVDVNSGEFSTHLNNSVLRALAIGSCIAVCMLDPELKTACLSHIMLPGKPTGSRKKEIFKYCESAFTEMLNYMKSKSVDIKNMRLFIVGGANVLKRKDDNIAEENIKSIRKTVNENRLEITAEDMGGNERRSLIVDVEKGSVTYTKGDSNEIILWQETK